MDPGMFRSRPAALLAIAAGVLALIVVVAAATSSRGGFDAFDRGADDAVSSESSRAFDGASMAKAPNVMPSTLATGGDTAGVAFDAAQEAPAPGAGSVDFLGRQIIRNGSVELEVESVVNAFEQVRSAAIAAGGFVAESSFFGRDEEQRARITIRVPADRFDAVVGELRGLAVEVLSISTSSQDVTGEVTDLESSLRNLRAVEVQYLDLLGRAGGIGEILQVQDRLNQTRAQIDRIEGRVQMLGRLTELATLTVSLQPVREPVVADGGSGPLDAAGEAWAASLATLSAIATAVLVVAVYSWWLVPFVAVGAFVLRRWLRAWAEGRPAAPAPVDTPPGTA